LPEKITPGVVFYFACFAADHLGVKLALRENED